MSWAKFSGAPENFAIVFWGVDSGKSEKQKRQDRDGIKESFLKTNELNIEGENHTRPGFLLAAPKRLCEADLPQQDAEAKTTTASTTQHAQNNHNAKPAPLYHK